ERQRQQESEQRKARHRLQRVRQEHNDRAEPRVPRGKDAGRHAEHNGRSGGEGDERHVLAKQDGQLARVSRPEGEERCHWGGTLPERYMSTSAFTRLSSLRATPSGVSKAIMRPASITPTLSPSANASAMSCVTSSAVVFSCCFT